MTRQSMTLNDDIPTFNLWTDDWLPLEMQDGSVRAHSIRDALVLAHERRAIQDPSPLVIVGVHRLLVAVLQDALRPEANADLDVLWNAGRFPQDKIASFGEGYADRFDLFSPDKPFLQSADLPLFPQTKEDERERASVAKLFIDIPTGTGIAHYRHSVEDEIVLSPASAALGLVAIPAFVSSGGPGLMPSINGVPPIYVLPGGRTVFEQLVSSLLASSGKYIHAVPAKDDFVWWRRSVPTVVTTSKKSASGFSLDQGKQLSTASYLHGLTFPARKVRLHPERLHGVCSRSGNLSAWVVKTMAFRMGESMSDDSIVWRDPFVAYKLPLPTKAAKSAKATSKESKEKPKPIRPSVNKGRAAWREFSGLFLRHSDFDKGFERPRILDQLNSLQISDSRFIQPFRCIGLQTDGKMKFFEWLDFGFDVPSALLRDPDGARWTDDAVNFATNCASTITRVFARAFGGESKRSPRFSRLKANMEADFWQSMGGKFRRYVCDLADATNRSATLDGWLDDAKGEAQAAFECAAKATGDGGNALRQIEMGIAECRRQLAALRQQTNQPLGSKGVTHDTVEPKTKRAKRTGR